ncbi:hypothetical protein EJB05_09726, partial [Eragrostis curvula]
MFHDHARSRPTCQSPDEPVPPRPAPRAASPGAKSAQRRRASIRHAPRSPPRLRPPPLPSPLRGSLDTAGVADRAPRPPRSYSSGTRKRILDMEQPSPSKVNEGATNDDDPAAYATMTYQPVALASVPPAGGAAFPPTSQGASTLPFNLEPVSEQHQTAFQQAQQFHQQQQQYQQEQLQPFWAGQMAEIEQITDFKQHSLPLARIKKIMKADEDVKMIAGEAPVVFAKACEMFILELTLRAWLQTEGTKRRTLQRNDVVAAITKTDMFDFLVDIIPPEELKGDGMVGTPPPTTVPSMVPSYVPGMTVPYETYANQQPVSFMWPLPEHQEEQHQQQTSDGGRDE